VRVDEDRRRAEKFKAKRARKASKRPFSGSATSLREAIQSVAPEEDYES